MIFIKSEIKTAKIFRQLKQIEKTLKIIIIVIILLKEEESITVKDTK